MLPLTLALTQVPNSCSRVKVRRGAEFQPRKAGLWPLSVKRPFLFKADGRYAEHVSPQPMIHEMGSTLPPRRI